MSELKLVSPLLDGFVMGEPFSDRNGVRCCPAMKENSDDKYIVKIISVPASQKQLDALLFSGAYTDSAAAAEYFKQLADDTVKEARLLQQLAKLEGFLSYEGWQIVPMEGNELGYDIYLLSSYRRSLETFLRRNAMTHLNAVNLGIDLCAALSLCRRAGFIYTALKPSNIFITGKQEYRIGDLGFAKLNAMKYTSMPGKNITRYTPPELHDPLATLNPTVDIYAVGLILYQIYNNGELPFATKAPLKYLPSPLNADYEMAEIIQKACDPNPRKRYQTPIEMGQALVSYMQRNSVNDIPIVPPVVDTVAEESSAAAAESLEPTKEVSEPIAVQPAETISESTEVNTPSEPVTVEELQFMDSLVGDETAPSADEHDDLADTPTSDEVDMILAQADALLSDETTTSTEPEEMTEPETEDITEPEVIETTEETSDEPLPEEPTADEDQDFSISFSEPVEENMEIDDLEFGLPTDHEATVAEETIPEGFEEITSAKEPKPRKKRGWIGLVITLLIFALLGGGAYYYYSNYYLLPIDDIEINGYDSSIVVELTTAVDESLLKVICTDTYGNKQEMPVSDGQAVFTNLKPKTTYKITVETEGLHKLTGSLTGSYTTAEVTNIIDFTAKAGMEDGSVVLSFTVDGPDSQNWTVEYSAEGEETKSVSFTGHMVTVTDLTVGKLYTFTLTNSHAEEMYLGGNTTLEHQACRIVVADSLTIVSCIDGLLTANWLCPEDTSVESWIVRCYSDDGYEQTLEVTDTTVEFDGISPDTAYTVEVTADGMSQSARAFVTANPVTVSAINFAYEPQTGLTVTWEADNTPDGGWLVMYSIDGSDTTEMAECIDNTAMIKNVIPNATYSIRIMAADGSTVFGSSAEMEGIEATSFNQYGLNTANLQISMCHSPEKENWTYEDVTNSQYTTSYAPGENASLVIYATSSFYLKTDETAVMFVIRNEEGKVIPTFTRTLTKVWRDMWPGIGKYCYLDIPVMPTAEGKYTLELYFNGQTVMSKSFSIINANG